MKRVYDDVTDDEYNQFRSVLGATMWLLRTRGELAYVASILASAVNTLRVEHVLKLNKVVRYLQLTSTHKLFLPRLEGDLWVAGICDAAAGQEVINISERAAGRYHGGFVIGIRSSHGGHGFAPIIWKSSKLKRVSGSSMDGETLIAMETTEVVLCLS